jgi:hypothetical protein
MYRYLIMFLTILLVIGLLATLLLTTEHYFSYRPSYEETVNFALKEINISKGNFVIAPGFQFHFEDVKITHVVTDIVDMHLVMGVYTLVDQDGVRNPTRCYYAKYITRYWLTGPRVYDSFGWQCEPSSARHLRPISVQDHEHDSGHYAVAGMVFDRAILSIKVRWKNGNETIVPIVDDIFLAINSEGNEAEWVIGLDVENKEISETLTYVSNNRFAPLGYDSFRQTATDGGVIVMGAYAERISPAKECFAMTYLSLRQVDSFYAGERASNWQSLCFEPDQSQTISPPLIISVNNTTVAGGIVLDPIIKEIRIDWSDGWQESVPVLNGFYFVQRPGNNFTIDGWSKE